MPSFMEMVENWQKTCGNCQFWQQQFKVEMPDEEGVTKVLAPCKLHAPERHNGGSMGESRIFTESEETCALDDWEPSREFLQEFWCYKRARREVLKRLRQVA